MHTSGIGFIHYSLEIGALELVPGLRKLKSGRMSPYFFNSGLFIKGYQIRTLAEFYADRITGQPVPDVIFGPSYKGSALAVALSMTFGQRTGYAYDRKETKDHGEGGDAVGHPLKGRKVALIDDVMTTGGSLHDAHDFVVNHGGIPIWSAIAFDRQETGVDSNFSAVQEFENKFKIPVLSVATLDNLLSVLSMSNLPMYQKVLDYKKEYGVIKT